jgi:hypothetical protein
VLKELGVFESDRGFPLVCQDAHPMKAILTVENYCKWYCLYLITSWGSVESVDFPVDGYCDHVPYPAAVARMAEEHDWIVDDQSMEIMVGRYVLEVLGKSIDSMGD